MVSGEESSGVGRGLACVREVRRARRRVRRMESFIVEVGVVLGTWYWGVVLENGYDWFEGLSAGVSAYVWR
jgi:hypothetical protein